MSIFHMEDPVRILVDARSMGDDQDAALRIEYVLYYEGDDHLPGITIQGGGRFVKNQDLGTADDRAGDGDALLLAAGELDWHNLAPAFQADDLEIQGGGRFVKNQDLGTADDRAGDGDALLLAAGELDWHNLAPAFQADDL